MSLLKSTLWDPSKCTSLLRLHFSAILIQTFHILFSLWSWTLSTLKLFFKFLPQTTLIRKHFAWWNSFTQWLHSTKAIGDFLCGSPKSFVNLPIILWVKLSTVRIISTTNVCNPHPTSGLDHQRTLSACSKGVLMLTPFWFSCYLGFDILNDPSNLIFQELYSYF